MKYLILALILFTNIAVAESIDNLIVSCSACHGVKGVSPNDLWPNLAAQKKDYLIKQLKEFKSDVRKDPIMNPMTKNLTDDDITKIAEYFSKLNQEEK